MNVSRAPRGQSETEAVTGHRMKLILNLLPLLHHRRGQTSWSGLVAGLTKCNKYVGVKSSVCRNNALGKIHFTESSFPKEPLMFALRIVLGEAVRHASVIPFTRKHSSGLDTNNLYKVMFLPESLFICWQLHIFFFFPLYKFPFPNKVCKVSQRV